MGIFIPWCLVVLIKCNNSKQVQSHLGYEHWVFLLGFLNLSLNDLIGMSQSLKLNLLPTNVLVLHYMFQNQRLEQQ